MYSKALPKELFLCTNVAALRDEGFYTEFLNVLPAEQ